MRIPKKLSEWQDFAEGRLQKILKTAQKSRSLLRLGAGSSWKVEVRVVGTATMKKLNHRYRNKNYATDVLSFPAGSPFHELGVLGELVICLPTLKAQATQFRHSFAVELEVLLVHGLLHLLGFDHEEGLQEARKMARWEKRLLAQTLKSGQRTKESPESPISLIARTDF